MRTEVWESRKGGLAEVRGARPCGGCHRSGAEKEEEMVREIGGDQEKAALIRG